MAPTVIPFAFPGIPGVGAAFATALGGESQGPFAGSNIAYSVGDDPAHVLANRSALRRQLGFSSWNTLRQVHGPAVIFEPETGDMSQPSGVEGDGLTTALPGKAMVIKTADCQPILLAHSSGEYVAALHVGWRGNVLGFPTSGVRAFCAHYGLKPQDVLAVRGPSLGPSASQFTNFAQEFGKRFDPWFNPENRCVDLWRLTKRQLQEAGILDRNIFGLDLCTYSLESFFSYRRNNVTGRQASMIWIREN